MLDKENIGYSTVDLSTDAIAMDMVKQMGYTAAPVVMAGSTHWSGFRMDKIKDLIDKIKTEAHA
jgi:glutaredoxin-like protein NrdH